MNAIETTTRKDTEAIIENLVNLGASWARYGLTVGRTALETSAKSLNVTASLLGDIAKRFESETSKS